MTAGPDAGATLERLAALAPHAGTLHHLVHAIEGPLVLARVAPDDAGRRHAARVVQAYDLVVTHHEPEAQLVVEGALDHPTRAVLQEALRRSNLPGGWLAGAVDDDVLVAFLTRAGAAVLAPEGDPLAAEVAMGFGLAIVGGPAHVVGPAGIPLTDDDGVAVWAEAIGAVLARPTLRRDLSARARRRAAERHALPA